MATTRELTSDEIVRRASEAKLLLANPMLQEAVATIDDALVLQWRSAKTTEDREAIWNRMRGLEAVMKQLQTVMMQGEHPSALRRADSRIQL